MRRIVGRRCENCGDPIDPYRPIGTRFCDNSCRADLWRQKHSEAPVPSEPQKRVQRRSRRRSRGRGDTCYAVFRLAYREARVMADLELVGFVTARKRERAIRRAADQWGPDEDGYPPEFVAIPMRDLVPHLGDGTKLSELAQFAIR